MGETRRTSEPQAERLAESDESGFALVSVVVICALIAVLAIGLTTLVRRLASASVVVTLDAEAKAGTEAGLNRIIMAYLRPGDPLRAALAPDSRPVVWAFAGKTLTLQAQAESGKLDLNGGDLEYIGAVVARLIEDPAASVGFLARLSAARNSGTTISTVAELLSPLDRMGARRDLIEAHFTVMTGQRGVDPATAPIAVLEALPRVSDEVRRTILSAREARRLVQIDSAEGTSVHYFVSERPVYTFRAQTADGFDRAGAMQAIVGFSDKGLVSIYAWAPVGIRR
jgi:hypothetical protein